MIHGYFLKGTYVPYVEISIFSGKNTLNLPVVLDTGFSGYLKIDHDTADELGIISIEFARITMFYGEEISVGFSYCFVELGNTKILTEILIFSGPPLIGIKLLGDFGYKAVVDCKNRTAHLERVG